MTRKVVLWEVHRTDKAILYQDDTEINPLAVKVWIPRSLIKHISKDPPVKGSNLIRSTVEIEEWFLDKYNL